MIAQTPEPPYFAVIFTSLRTDGDSGYAAMSELMESLAKEEPGFLGIESARSGLGVTVSYWDSLESVARWKENMQHLVAQQRGRESWYCRYRVRICQVERDYGWGE